MTLGIYFSAVIICRDIPSRIFAQEILQNDHFGLEFASFLLVILVLANVR